MDTVDIARLTSLSDEDLRARIRTAKKQLAIARNTVATAHKIVTADRAIASAKEADLKFLQLEQNRRSDEAVAKVRDWMEEQSNFEKQLAEIASAILHYFPDEFAQNGNGIPKAACAIIERCALKDSPRATASTDPPPTDQPKQ